MVSWGLFSSACNKAFEARWNHHQPNSLHDSQNDSKKFYRTTISTYIEFRAHAFTQGAHSMETKTEVVHRKTTEET